MRRFLAAALVVVTSAFGSAQAGEWRWFTEVELGFYDNGWDASTPYVLRAGRVYWDGDLFIEGAAVYGDVLNNAEGEYDRPGAEFRMRKLW